MQRGLELGWQTKIAVLLCPNQARTAVSRQAVERFCGSCVEQHMPTHLCACLPLLIIMLALLD